MSPHPGRRLPPLRWPGLLGLALIAVALTAETAVRQPLAERVQAIEARGGQAERAGSRPSMAPGTDLARFYAHFRREEGVNDWLAVLYHAAEQSGVDLGVAEYRLAPNPVLALSAYEISMPLSGDYGKLRAFSEAVLNSIPVASLDALRFARKRAGSTQVEAQMRLTLYVVQP